MKEREEEKEEDGGGRKRGAKRKRRRGGRRRGAKSAPVAIERSVNHGHLQEFRGRVLLSAKAGQQRGRRRAFTNVAEAGPHGSEADETEKNLCAPRAFLERCEKARDALCPSKDEDFTNVADAGPHGSEADETEKNVCASRVFLERCEKRRANGIRSKDDRIGWRLCPAKSNVDFA